MTATPSYVQHMGPSNDVIYSGRTDRSIWYRASPAVTGVFAHYMCRAGTGQSHGTRIIPRVALVYTHRLLDVEAVNGSAPCSTELHQEMTTEHRRTQAILDRM